MIPVLREIVPKLPAKVYYQACTLPRRRRYLAMRPRDHMAPSNLPRPTRRCGSFVAGVMPT